MTEYKRYFQLHVDPGQSIFLWGARKTGKSTFLKKHIQYSLYIDLLKTDVFFRYAKRPHILREEILAMSNEDRAKPIIIDEIQKIPALLDEVHYLIENTKATFVLCGSSSRKLKLVGTNLLGGRAIKYYFYPLSYTEYKQDLDLLRIFNDGLIPSHYKNKNSKKLLNAYIEDYLTNEIRAESYVRNIAAFSRFIDCTKYSCGEMVNYSNIARDVGIDAKTIKEYFQILVDTLVGYLIFPYTKTGKRSLISSTPKFYYFDIGLSNRISKKSINSLDGPDAGKSLEHLVLMELIAYVNYNDSDYKINYWRTNTGIEVDFVLTDGEGPPLAFEVKISANIYKTQLSALKAFMREYSCDTSYLICTEPTKRKLELDENKTIWILPIEEFMQMLWEKKFFI